MFQAEEYQKSTTGFTFIEIIVVVAIVGMMATLSVTNFQAGQEDEALRIGALRIADQLRVAQNYAQTGIHAGTPSARAYGVYVKKPGTIILFADLSSSNPVGIRDAGDPDIGSPITLKVGSRSSVQIDQDIGITLDGVSRDEVMVAFRAPNAAGLIDGKTESNSMVITLRNTRNKHTKTVTINRITGRVDTEF